MNSRGLHNSFTIGLLIIGSAHADDVSVQCAAAQTKAINFLAHVQQESGGFLTYEWPTLQPERKRIVDTPFTVSQVLYSTRFCKESADLEQLRSRAVRYLLDQKDAPGVWRYFGKSRNMSPDLDDTALAWAALERAGEHLPAEALSAIRASRNDAGLFNTWMGEPSTWHGVDSTATDAVVNANALLSLHSRETDLEPVCAYLNLQAQGEAIKRGTVYYTPLMFALAFSRAYSAGANCLEKGTRTLRDSVIALQQANTGWGDDLETAAATLTLLNLRDHSVAVDKGINAILSHQMSDGGWTVAAAYSGDLGRRRYGSRAVTTALCVEALAKYMLR